MGHGFDDPTALDIAWTGIAGFLKANLGDPPAQAAASASTTPAMPSSPATAATSGAGQGEGK
jgi:hypothetical protein